jgi:hypothetical protein
LLALCFLSTMWWTASSSTSWLLQPWCSASSQTQSQWSQGLGTEISQQ